MALLPNLSGFRHPTLELRVKEVVRSTASFTHRQTIRHKVVASHAKQRQLRAHSRSSYQGSTRKFGQAPKCLVFHKSRKSVFWLVEDSLPACSRSGSCSVSSVVVLRGLIPHPLSRGLDLLAPSHRGLRFTAARHKSGTANEDMLLALQRPRKAGRRHSCI